MSYERDIERGYDRYCDRELERLAREEWEAEHPGEAEDLSDEEVQQYEEKERETR